MGYYTTAEIVKIVNRLIDRCGTRNPYRVAKELGINIIYRNFDKQRGAYKVILKNRFIFLKITQGYVLHRQKEPLHLSQKRYAPCRGTDSTVARNRSRYSS